MVNEWKKITDPSRIYMYTCKLLVSNGKCSTGKDYSGLERSITHSFVCLNVA